ncbi:MAG: hypothetical protein ACYDCQ_09310 [Dehalococcoidia bacterium]
MLGIEGDAVYLARGATVWRLGASGSWSIVEGAGDAAKATAGPAGAPLGEFPVHATVLNGCLYWCDVGGTASDANLLAGHEPGGGIIWRVERADRAGATARPARPLRTMTTVSPAVLAGGAIALAVGVALTLYYRRARRRL